MDKFNYISERRYTMRPLKLDRLLGEQDTDAAVNAAIEARKKARRDADGGFQRRKGAVYSGLSRRDLTGEEGEALARAIARGRAK